MAAPLERFELGRSDIQTPRPGVDWQESVRRRSVKKRRSIKKEVLSALWIVIQVWVMGAVVIAAFCYGMRGGLG